jgi:hemerythrin-like domain-containing protein
MLEEHLDEKKHLSALAQAVDQDDWTAIRREGEYLLQLLRNHIWKEDNILFPMAEDLLDEEARLRTRQGFEKIGSCCPECACSHDPSQPA